MVRKGVNKVFVASYSLSSPLGLDTEENMKAITDYKSGIKLVEEASLFCKPMYASKIFGEHTDPDLSTLERRSIFSVQQALNLLKDFVDEDFLKETQLIFSTTKGDVTFLESGREILDSRVFLNHTAKVTANYFKLKREPLVVSNACISGVNAVVSASRLISSGYCKHAIIVGADLLSRFVVTGFQSFHSISTGPCIPYDTKRDGLTLGEAVGVIVLTGDRAIVSEEDPIVVEGGAISNDANHLSAPSRTGDGLAEAMSRSITIAGIKAEEIDFINAHGTATLYNDEMEAKAIHLAGLSGVAVQSLKPYWGHTLGASGVIESIGCFWQMKNSMLFGTKGYTQSGVPMEIKVNASHESRVLKRCIKTASGFGGCNAAVIYAFDSVSGNSRYDQPANWRELSRFSLSGTDGFHDIIRDWNRRLENTDLKFFKMDDLSKLGYIGVLKLLKDNPEFSDILPEKRGLFFGNTSSSLASDIRHVAAIGAEDDLKASPAIFVYTLPNVVLGEICIKNKFKGENTFFVFNPSEKINATEILLRNASLSGMELVVAGWCDLIGEKYDLNIGLYKKV
ncbi:3-oxoacyl-[acyl-carrier-protein] synthase, KASII [Bacteroidales bacterium CF]|jgi:3-oxoacyl-(acyl-carrier-protein) synthase|nr:3-oxoacyl-[acyl-carrier-protein] synthase, KASII [Bacteroidales bacterium CF]